MTAGVEAAGSRGPSRCVGATEGVWAGLLLLVIKDAVEFVSQKWPNCPQYGNHFSKRLTVIQELVTCQAPCRPRFTMFLRRP